MSTKYLRYPLKQGLRLEVNLLVGMSTKYLRYPLKQGLRQFHPKRAFLLY